MGDYRMAFVCPSVCPSICPSVFPSVTLSCPLHISWTLWKIFIKLWSNVCLSESMCRTYKSTMPTQGQGHRSKVMGLSLEFHFRSISPMPLEGFSLNFGHMFASVRQCAELITQPCRHKVKSQFKFTGLSLEFRVRSVSPIPVEGFSLNFGQMFTLVKRCAESVTQPCRLKVTVQGHGFEPWISCPLCISFTPGRIFSKLWSNVHLWDDVQNP